MWCIQCRYWLMYHIRCMVESAQIIYPLARLALMLVCLYLQAPCGNCNGRGYRNEQNSENNTQQQVPCQRCNKTGKVS